MNSNLNFEISARREGERTEEGKNTKEGATYITDRVDVDVVFGVLWVRHKRLNEELSQNASSVLDLLLLSSSLSDPGLGFSPGLVQGQETTLASTLDELIGLCDEFGARLQKPRVGHLSLVQDILNVGILGESQRSQARGSIVCGRLGERTRLDDRSPGEVIVEDGLAVGLGNRLGGHGDVRRRRACERKEGSASEFECLESANCRI